tara:strand:+ start:628 stop:1302 length:675 start_codon:yes stop_codon:yes gene_type:complete
MEKIYNRIKEQQDQKSEYTVFGSIPIIIKDKLTNYVDMTQLVKTIETLLPRFSKNLVKAIIVADHPIFDMKKVNAFYYDKKMYISNHQDDLNDMLDDIVHEYAHVLEKEYSKEIYSDKIIEDEFLLKRRQLERIIKYQDFDINEYDFDDIKYNKELDNFLLNVIGYERFGKLTNYGLFINPYAATSLREYYATGFEEYMLGDHQELQTISPKLFNKIKNIVDNI